MTLGFLIRVSSERANFMAFEMVHVMYEAFVYDGVENRRIVIHRERAEWAGFPSNTWMAQNYFRFSFAKN